MKKVSLFFLFLLLAISYQLRAVFAAAPPHPLVYDVGRIPPGLESKALSPRQRVPKFPNFTVAQKAQTTGTTKVLVLLVEFQDITHSTSHTQSYYNNLYFSQNQGYKSLYDYYNEISYQQLQITGNVVNQWYKSIYDMSDYGADGSQVDNLNGPIYDLVTEVVKQADSNVDFSQYDGDNDGIVDHLLIVHAGQGQERYDPYNSTPYDIWSHRWEVYDDYTIPGTQVLMADGKQIRNYTMVSEYSPIGIVAHELAHDLGLYDLYNTLTGDTVVGDWDLMDGGAWLGPGLDGTSPCHPNGWDKIRLGWVTPEVLTSRQLDLQVYPLETTKNDGQKSIYKLKIDVAADPNNEYFLIEYRKKTGFDTYLPGEGLLIWHIDDTILSTQITDYAVVGNSPDTAANLNVINCKYYHDSYGSPISLLPHIAVDLIEADNTDATSQASDPFPGTDNVTIFKKPKSDAYNGNVSNITLEQIQLVNNLYISFDFNTFIFNANLDIVKSYNFPNPAAGGKTKIKVYLTNRPQEVSLKIYNLNGELIRSVIDEDIREISQGNNNLVLEYNWDGKNDEGEKVASGIYIYYVKVDNLKKIGRIAVIK